MSVADLKTRLADVPRIEELSMKFEGGRILLRWADYSATVDAASSDQEIETAVRNAIKLPPIAMLPEKAPVELTNPKERSTMSGATAAGLSIKQMLEDHQRDMTDLMEAHKATMRAGFAKQMRAVQAVGSLAAKADSDGDDFLAMVGQFTNALGGE